MTPLNQRTTPEEKQQAFHTAMRSHPQLRQSLASEGGKWYEYFNACDETGWTMAPKSMRDDIRAWQNSTPSRDSAVVPMRELERALY